MAIYLGDTKINRLYVGNSIIGPSFVGDSKITNGLLAGIEYTGTPLIQPLGDGSVTYTFTGAGSVTPVNDQGFNGSISVELLLIAGGGGGGYNWALGICPFPWIPGGGGGAGEYYYDSSLALTYGETYDITVGAGGRGGTGPTSAGEAESGDDSTFGNLTVKGGGRGSSKDDNGESGGSGGGGAGTNLGLATFYLGKASTATIGLGNAGADATNFGSCSTGGYMKDSGGGGGSASAGSGTSGGLGTSNSITGTAVTYAAGGDGSAGLGGTGDAGANPGDGGGRQAAGADGIVIIKVSTL